jgi:putative SOS response-associated peptidase YedK
VAVFHPRPGRGWNADHTELIVRRWSWPSPNGKPVFNMRSGGREFPKDRCLVPLDGFYEIYQRWRSGAEAQELLVVPPCRGTGVRDHRPAPVQS